MEAEIVDHRTAASPDAESEATPDGSTPAEGTPVDAAAGPEDPVGTEQLPATVAVASSVPLDHGIVRALANGAAPGAVIEQAANAIRVLCPDRGVAVWYRRPNETSTVQAAGIGAHMVMITGDPDSPFWDRARTEERPNYNITFRPQPDDIDPTSVWCVPAIEGPAAGDLMLVVVGRDDGSRPEEDVRTGVEHIVRLIGVSLDRKRLVERLEKDQDRPDGPAPEVEMGLAPTAGDAEEPEETVLLYVRLAQIKDIDHLHGHKAAEELIEEVGKRLSHTVRPGDTVARLSDTDFALRCYRVTAIQAESIVSRLLNDLWTPVVTRWEETRLKPRIGLSRAAEPTPLSRLLKRSDAAMRRADSAGRDWLWDTDEIDRKPAELGPAPTGNGFGAGPSPDPSAGAAPTDGPDQSVPGLLADSEPGSPE